jgi:elongation factor P
MQPAGSSPPILRNRSNSSPSENAKRLALSVERPTARTAIERGTLPAAQPLILEWISQRVGGDALAALIDAIDVKRKSVFEHEGVPYACLDVEVNTPTARGGQTLVRLKMRNLLTSAVFEKSFKASDKFKEPDLVYVDVSYLYTDGAGSHFLDQESYETLTLNEDMLGDAMEFLVEGVLLQVRKFNGNPIGLELPIFVELDVTQTEPGVKGDSSSGSVTKVAKLQTGLEIRVPLFIKQGEKVKVATETREFAGRA